MVLEKIISTMESLTEMKMTELEVIELKKWLEVAHEERMKQMTESENIWKN